MCASTVEVDVEKSVLRAGSVQHLYGRLSGTLHPDADDGQILVSVQLSLFCLLGPAIGFMLMGCRGNPVAQCSHSSGTHHCRLLTGLILKLGFPVLSA